MSKEIREGLERGECDKIGQEKSRVSIRSSNFFSRRGSKRSGAEEGWGGDVKKGRGSRGGSEGRISQNRI